MAIASRGGGQNANASASNLAVTMSATAVSGDYLIAVAAFDDPGATITWPSGFTQRGILTRSGDGGLLAWADKIAGGAEPSSYTIAASNGPNNLAVGVWAWSGVDNTTPRDVTPTSSAAAADTSPHAVTATGVASGSANRWLVYIGGLDNVSLGTVTSDAPSASPSTWNERIDVSDGEFVNIALYDCIDAAGTYTSSVTATQTGGGSAERMAFLIALREAGGGGSPAAGGIPPDLLQPQRRFQHMMVR